jgi:cell division protein FtsZ
MVKKLKKITKKTSSKITAREPKSQREKIKKTKIRVIGIGGGGGTIVSEIASRLSKASFVVANTDLQALRSCGRKVTRFQFGQNLTHGLGTGMNAELGKEAALNEKDKIKKLLEGQDLCIIVTCLGGGAGSGAAPVFAKISKSLGNLTYGIFTLPFKFEGEKKMEIARESLRGLKNYLNIITLIPNERVFQIIDKATPLRQALSIINKNLTESLAGLIETIYTPGLINIDFADLKTILEGQGRLSYLNTVEVQRKEEAIKDLMTKVLNSPLYPYTIRGAKGVLFNIAGEKELSLAEVNQISKTISELVNPEAKIIFGISQRTKYSDAIKTTLLATGCSLKLFPSKKKKAKKKKIIEKEGQIVKPKRKKQRKLKKEAKPSTISQPKPRKRKKMKIKVIKKSEEKLPAKLETETKPVKVPDVAEERIRKNGLQIKKEAEEEEKEMLEKEKFWETPAFLRKKPEKT